MGKEQNCTWPHLYTYYNLGLKISKITDLPQKSPGADYQVYIYVIIRITLFMLPSFYFQAFLDLITENGILNLSGL